SSRAARATTRRSRRRAGRHGHPRPPRPRAPDRAPAGCRGCRTGRRARLVRLPEVKIVCLVKQVPRADAIEFDQETKQLKREGVPLLLNPFDAAAVQHAAKLRDRHGAEVIAMTMGPPQAEHALRTCLSLGADRCIHLCDRVFAVADTLGTSRTLAMAIQREGDVDL